MRPQHVQVGLAPCRPFPDKQTELPSQASFRQMGPPDPSSLTLVPVSDPPVLGLLAWSARGFKAPRRTSLDPCLWPGLTHVCSHPQLPSPPLLSLHGNTVVHPSCSALSKTSGQDKSPLARCVLLALSSAGSPAGQLTGYQPTPKVPSPGRCGV